MDKELDPKTKLANHVRLLVDEYKKSGDFREASWDGLLEYLKTFVDNIENLPRQLHFYGARSPGPMFSAKWEQVLKDARQATTKEYRLQVYETLAYEVKCGALI